MSASDLVLVYSSSIVFEPMLQQKLICNAKYLIENPTILDGCGAVVDTHSRAEVIDPIEQV